MATKRERKALAKKVRAVADYVDRVGLHKGRLTEHGPTRTAVANGVKCCTIGAIRAHELDYDVVDELGVYLAQRHPRLEAVGLIDGRPMAGITEWNDAKSRRKKDVVDLLRGFADKLESGQ